MQTTVHGQPMLSGYPKGNEYPTDQTCFDEKKCNVTYESWCWNAEKGAFHEGTKDEMLARHRNLRPDHEVQQYWELPPNEVLREDTQCPIKVRTRTTKNFKKKSNTERRSGGRKGLPHERKRHVEDEDNDEDENKDEHEGRNDSDEEYDTLDELQVLIEDDEDNDEDKNEDEHEDRSDSDEKYDALDELQVLIEDGVFDLDNETETGDELVTRPSTKPKRIRKTGVADMTPHPNRVNKRPRIFKPSRLFLKGVERRKEEMRREEERRNASTHRYMKELEMKFPGIRDATRSRDAGQIARVFMGTPLITLKSASKRKKP